MRAEQDVVATSGRLVGKTLVGDAARAVTHRGSHVQIVASAGSGKTEVVAQRIADLLANDCDPTGLVAFTFTTRAADSLKQRVEDRVAERLGERFLDKMNGCFIGTIHSYCLRLLQQHVPGYETYEILDDHRLAVFLTRMAKALSLRELSANGKLFSGIRDFLGSLDVVDNELLSEEDLEDPFKTAVVRFRGLLEEYRFLTYGRLVALAVEALSDPGTFSAVHGPLRHLVVDEYQDVNPAQEALIGCLACAPVELCVVGDDDQAIYQWRGSDVRNIVHFEKRYPRVTAFRLGVNYRSRPGIIVAANRVSDAIEDRIPKAMSPERDAAPPEVSLWRASTEAEEASEIANAIKVLRRRGYRYRDVAVLVRGRVSYRRLLEAFGEHNIPVAPGGRSGLFLSADAQRFGRTFAWLADQEWREESRGRGTPVTLDALLEDYRGGCGLDGRALAALRRRLESWKEEVSSATRPANLVRSYYELLAACGVDRWDFDDPLVIARLGALARCSAILADYESVRLRPHPDPDAPGEVVGGQDRGEWYYRWLAIHIQNWSLGSFEGFDGEEDLTLDAVDLTTVHQAKGLEWPIVFVPSVSEGRFPSSMHGSPRAWLVGRDRFPADRYEGTLDDERRLFYVALTRARDWLSVSTHDRVTTRTARLSPFWGHLCDEGGPVQRSLDLPPNPPRAEADPNAPLALSYSDLARYRSCGLAYRLRTLLGFQPPLAPELGYGNAIHHILRSVAEGTRRQGRAPTPRDVDRLFDDEFVLPAASKRVHRELKTSARRLVDRYVHEWQDDLQKVWELERPFELHLPGVIVSGRADVILDDEAGGAGSLSIVDYKTATSSDDDHDLQLQLYTAAGRREGLAVRAAYVHDLSEGTRAAVDVGSHAVASAEATVVALGERVKMRDFSATPSSRSCGRCDVRPLCRWAM